MPNTIGMCINSSDKIDIDKVVSDNIDVIDDKLTRTRNSRKELIALGANPDELANRFESKKSILKNLLSRIRNTPDCK